MKKLLVVLVAATLLLSGGIAYASIPGPDGVIHGCRKTSNPSTGSVIVIDSAASCPSGYEPLNWNQVGPQGSPGISGLEEIGSQFQTTLNPGQFYTSSVVNCDTPKRAISATYFAFTNADLTYGLRRVETGGGQTSGYRVEVLNGTAASQSLDISVGIVCATVS